MQVTQTSAEGLKRAYTIIVEASVLSEKLEKKLADLAGQIRLPGFRPGKVPVSHLRGLHGKALLGEVLEETVNTSSRDALEQDDVKPALQPEIDIKEFEEGQDLEYAMSVEILPEIEAADFSKVSVVRETVEVEEAEIKEALDRLASQQTSYEAAKAKTYKAKNDDAVFIDFVGKLDGTPFDGGAAEGYQLVLGSDSFIPGFEEQLIGVKAGDEKAVTVTFPEEYQSEDLAGKEAVFDVTVQEVRQPVAVEIDDQLAEKLGMENLEALREQIKKQVSGEFEQVSRSKLKRQVLDALAETHDFEVPEGMVELEVNQMWEDLVREIEGRGEDLESQEKSEEEMRAEYRDVAVRRVRLGLLLSDVGTKNEIQVGPEELNAQMMKEAQRFPGQEQMVFEFYQKNPQAMQQLSAPLFEDKVIDFILEVAKVTEKKVSREELFAPPPEEGADKPKKPAAKGRGGKKAAPAKKRSAAKSKATKDQPAEQTDSKSEE